MCSQDLWTARPVWGSPWELSQDYQELREKPCAAISCNYLLRFTKYEWTSAVARHSLCIVQEGHEANSPPVVYLLRCCHCCGCGPCGQPGNAQRVDADGGVHWCGVDKIIRCLALSRARSSRERGLHCAFGRGTSSRVTWQVPDSIHSVWFIRNTSIFSICLFLNFCKICHMSVAYLFLKFLTILNKLFLKLAFVIVVKAPIYSKK